MKKFIITAICLFTSFGSFAQDSMVADEAKLVSQMFGMEKKAVILQYLNLNEADQATFLELYDGYQAKQLGYTTEYLTLLNHYTSEYEGLSMERIQEILFDLMSNEAKSSKNEQKFVKAVSKKVNPKVAASFLQIDSYITRATKLQIQEALPAIQMLNPMSEKK